MPTRFLITCLLAGLSLSGCVDDAGSRMGIAGASLGEPAAKARGRQARCTDALADQAHVRLLHCLSQEGTRVTLSLTEDGPDARVFAITARLPVEAPLDPHSSGGQILLARFGPPDEVTPPGAAAPAWVWREGSAVAKARITSGEGGRHWLIVSLQDEKLATLAVAAGPVLWSR